MSLSPRHKLMGSHELNPSLRGLEKAAQFVAFNSLPVNQTHEWPRAGGWVGEPGWSSPAAAVQVHRRPQNADKVTGYRRYRHVSSSTGIKIPSAE